MFTSILEKSNCINEIHSILFLLTRERDDRKDIKLEWIEFVFHHPLFEFIQSDGRIKLTQNLSKAHVDSAIFLIKIRLIYINK